jgi:hypothetical protein
MLNKQNEIVLLNKLGVMLKEQMKRHESEQDNELIAIFKRTIDDLKRQTKRKAASNPARAASHS